jgi:hypothetical protein
VPPGHAADGPAAQSANDPTTCPYCGGSPELMEPAGIVSHGGFEFASSDTKAIDGFMSVSDIRWIESEHFQIGMALGPFKVKQRDKEKIRAELTELQAVFPEVNVKTKVIDPWLRAHMYAQRVEKVWDRFLELMRVEESAFPPVPTKWDMQGRYMGDGPYVGQKGKFEVLLLPSQAASTTFLETEFGLLIELTQRWNVIPRDTLILVAHTGQGQLRVDAAMHNHVVFNMAINLLDGYKHFSYETPIWIREGLAHFMEREQSPEYNSFDSSEGSVADMTRKTKWEPEVRKLIASGGAVRMAELVALKDYAGLELAHHYTTWSMTDYLLKTNPEGYACLNDRLHGITDAQGMSDGSNMADKHRDAFRECIGVSYPEFDSAWAEWVMANYASK